MVVVGECSVEPVVAVSVLFQFLSVSCVDADRVVAVLLRQWFVALAGVVVDVLRVHQNRGPVLGDVELGEKVVEVCCGLVNGVNRLSIPLLVNRACWYWLSIEDFVF